MEQLAISEDIPKLPIRYNTKIDLQKAIEYRLKGLSYQEIANFFNCSKSAVYQKLSPYLPDQLDLKAYKKNRADIIAGKQWEVLKCLTPAVIKKAPAGTMATIFGILYDKERLETDKSTGNLAININIPEIGKD